jgi:predicted Ser/Thr protein kinase
MPDDEKERIEGLEPKSLFRVALGDPADDSEAAARAAEEEQAVRAEIERRLPDLQLLELLGRGGMGYVYRARQTKLDREVALKVVAPDEERQADFVQRFAREAKALARLSHPNIVAVYDYGQEDSFCWLMMEYVEGSNLRDVIGAGKLEPGEALALVPKICEALQFAHDQGVVHRDVKPENILLDASGSVKIADFGLAKLTGAPAALVTLTGSQQVLGTFRYMAPEQLDRPLEVDHRADIYSLGVVFYEMLTGELPMGRFDPPSLSSGASTGVDDVVLRALQREPARRYQRAAEVKSDLDSLENGERPPLASPAPRLSIRAVVSVALYGVGLVPVMMILVALLLAAGPAAGTVDDAAPSMRSQGVSMALVLSLIPTLIGLTLMITASVQGFRALKEIHRDWPRVYGAGAAVVGAWAGLLLFANSALLAVVLGLKSVPDQIPPRALLLGILLLLVSDVVFLVLYRRRFVQQCQAK